MIRKNYFQTMRYAVISDIHGNIEALHAVVNDIDSRRVDAIICLGDIVGYYADPEECIRLVRERTAHVVAGNHDYAATGKLDTGNFTFYAFKALEWTKQALSEESRKYLAALPLTYAEGEMLFVHSSPAKPAQFIYLFPNSQKAIVDAFNTTTHRITFVGHAHWPFILGLDEKKTIHCSNESVAVDIKSRYLINVGSVGQPRNYDPKATYGLYDTDEALISLIRISYDFSLTQKKVISNSLPPFLAERLEKGR
jgi:predicted phosphodiesterase